MKDASLKLIAYLINMFTPLLSTLISSFGHLELVLKSLWAYLIHDEEEWKSLTICSKMNNASLKLVTLPYK